MKHLNWILLLFVSLSASAQTIFLPATYGATGDGKTDDTKALNACIGAAVKVRNSVVDLGTGTYLCNQVAADQTILDLNGTFTQDVTIKGEDAVIQTSSDNSTLLYAFAFAPGQRLTIQGIAFKSTHPLTTTPTIAIFIQGTNGMNWSGVTVKNCTFDGFGETIGAQGVTGLSILFNGFAATLGHDAGENNENPDVYIWLHDSENGYCDSVLIQGNTADGYTGSGPISTLTTQRPMDGFVFGVAYNTVITDNHTRNFGEEQYFLHPAGRPIAHTTTVTGNDLDCSIPAGSRFENAPLTSNYGIRIDDNNVTVKGNSLKNYTWGIMVRACDYPAPANFPPTGFANYVIDNNDLTQAQDTTAYKPWQGIYIVGPVTGLRITNNGFHGATADPMLIYQASAVEYNNVKF